MGTAHDWSIEFHDASEGKTEEINTTNTKAKATSSVAADQRTNDELTSWTMAGPSTANNYGNFTPWFSTTLRRRRRRRRG